VAIQRNRTYGVGLEPTMRRLFDNMGGLGRIVKNKTVTVKVNMTGRPSQRLGALPLERTHWTHPRVIGMTILLMDEAGATRIRIVESAAGTAEPLENVMASAGWNVEALRSAGRKVEFVNTNSLAGAKAYARLSVPGGGLIFPGFDLHPVYRDCDAFVSIAKMKEHATAGVTLSLKNCFGITPCTIYGDGAGLEEPGTLPDGERGAVVYAGSRGPSKSAPQELDPASPRNGGFRVPRVVADLAAARPVDLAVVDAAESMAGGQGPWIAGSRHRRPAVILAGRNAVCTDAVAMAVMGFDPMAARGAAPFENCDNTLEMAGHHGLGSRDLGEIEVAGAQIADIRYPMRGA